jgi:glyoxylase-like metal-dependent hydrolase (beta-lactamase superfamily II)
MPTLSSGLSWIDLEFRGRPDTIAAAVARGGDGIAIIDPGPASCLGVLERELRRHGIELAEVTHILLTHIHLDHAGATGTLVGRHPSLRVVVHERGAPHLVDPSKLLQSATRLYGAEMEALWGEVLPVPPGNVVTVGEGDVVEAGGRRFDVAYTPGHAVHHVCYFDASSGVAFAGDTAGVCVNGGYVLPPTPPPDIDLDLWAASVARIERWSPATLFMTHFGPAPSVRPHLRTLVENLTTIAQMVRRSLALDGSDEARQRQFEEELGRDLRRSMTEAQAAAYESATPFGLMWLGLARYWRKRGAGS